MQGSRATAELDEYRITSSAEIHDLLMQLVDKRALVNLSGPHGQSFTTLLWAVDTQRQTLSFSGEDETGASELECRGGRAGEGLLGECCDRNLTC